MGLRQRVPDLHYAVTATTRAPRFGEIPDQSYFFISEETFEEMRNRGELLAPARVHGHWYGAPVHCLEAAFAAGRDVLLKIDVQGARQVRRMIPDAVCIFLAPPSIEDLIERLSSRQTESQSGLEERIRDAHVEMDQVKHYDYLVTNHANHLEVAVCGLACIIRAERLRVKPRTIRLLDR